MPATAILIQSSAHSGSTWLGYVLGSMPRAAFVGELYRTWDADDRVPCTLCAGRGRATCPVLDGLEHVPKPAAFGVLAERTGRSVVVDNSKKEPFIREVAADPGLDVRLLHVLRDPRGWLASVRRRNPTLLEWALDRWVEDNTARQDVLRRTGRPFRVVMYDLVARAPETGLADLLDFCGLRFSADALDYGRIEHHALAANGASAALVQHHRLPHVPAHYATGDDRYYAEAPRDSVIDRRWMSELDAADRRRVMAHGPTREFLGRFGFTMTDDGVERLPTASPPPRP